MSFVMTFAVNLRYTVKDEVVLTDCGSLNRPLGEAHRL